jgi:hypothetical protein
MPAAGHENLEAMNGFSSLNPRKQWENKASDFSFKSEPDQ